MLSTIVFVPPPLPATRRSGAVVRTLAALVPATVEGVVRDVTLLRTGEGDDFASIAEEAGCRVAAGADFASALARAADAARARWILVIQAGASPTRLFGEEVARMLAEDPGTRGGLLLRELARGGPGRWFPALAPPAGVVLPQARLAEARCAAFTDVLRRARPARALPTPAPVHR